MGWIGKCLIWNIVSERGDIALLGGSLWGGTNHEGERDMNEELRMKRTRVQTCLSDKG